MQLINYSGTRFKLKINRDIYLLNEGDAADILGTSIAEGIDWVGYKTINKMTNTGKEEWTRETGTLSIWMLDMFTPGENITVVIPFEKGDMKKLGPVAIISEKSRLKGLALEIRLFFLKRMVRREVSWGLLQAGLNQLPEVMMKINRY